MSIIRILAQQVKTKEREMTLYNSHLNYFFYGEFAKSTCAASLSTLTEEPVLLISPAGGSTYLQADYPNMISYPINDLAELKMLIDDLSKNMEAIRRLQVAIMANDNDTIKKAEAHYKKVGEDWNYILDLAKSGKFPVSAVVLEEVSTIANWIQCEVEEELEIVAAGQDKKSLGSDWNILKRRQMDFFTRFLKLPCTSILASGSKLPNESQAINSIMPNICTGAAERQLRDLIGNIFYFYKDDNGRFKVKLTGDKKIFAKDKLLSPYTKQKLPAELDLTGNPEIFWTTLNDLRQKDIADREKGLLKKADATMNAKKV